MTQFLVNTINWIKSNKLVTILIFVVAYLALNQKVTPYLYQKSFNAGSKIDYNVNTEALGKSMGFAPTVSSPIYDKVAPALEISDRRVVTNSQMSILTKNVRDTSDTIHKQAEDIGGYMVSKNISTPRAKGSESASIVVRLPIEKREEFVKFLRTVGLKVVNERISSNDVTDEFVDIQKRIESLDKIKARYEEILSTTSNVDQILKIEQNIQNTQRQIDSLIGQLNYMNTTSRSTLITVNLSTDELALPFAPENPWRPNIIFKFAVRSLLTNVQKLGTGIIWIAVYAVLWVPVIFVWKYFKRRKETKSL